MNTPATVFVSLFSMMFVSLLLIFAPPCVAADQFAEYFAKAEKSYNQERYNQAAREASTVIRIAPNRYEGYFLRARAIRKGGNPLDSLKDYKKALELCSIPKQQSEIYLSRGLTYALLKQTDMAILDYKKAIEAYPTSHDGHSRLVALYEDAGQYNRAIEICSQAISKNIKVREFYVSRARLYSKSKGRKNALSDIETALRLEPDNATTQYIRARILAEFKEYPEAIKQLRALIKRKSSNARYKATLGAVLILSGRNEEALSFLTKAVTKHNTSPSVHNNLAVLLLKLGRKNEAKKHFEEAVEHDPTHSKLYYKNHAQISAMTGDIGSIVDDYVGMDEASMDSRPQGRSADDIRKVITRFDKVISLNPSDADNYFNRGMQYFALGDFKSADRDLSTYLKKEKKKGEAWNFAIALRSLSLRRQHKDEAAQELLAATDFSDQWANALKKYLMGDSSQQDFLSQSTGRKRTETSRCFIGLKLIADGNNEAAKESLTWLKKNCNPNYDEYLLATGALTQLEPLVKKEASATNQKRTQKQSSEKLQRPQLIMKY